MPVLESDDQTAWNARIYILWGVFIYLYLFDTLYQYELQNVPIDIYMNAILGVRP